MRWTYTIDLYRDISSSLREESDPGRALDGESSRILVHEVVDWIEACLLTYCRVEAESYGNGGRTWCNDNIAAFVNVRSSKHGAC
jgi:hypothetical protein